MKWMIACVDIYVWETGKLGALKKEIWVLLRAPLFLGKRCGVATYFFIPKKRKRKKIQLYMTEMLHCHWLNKNKYKLDKLNLTRLWVLVTIYQKNTWLFVLVTIYPKIKIEIKPRSTYPKKLNSEARLQNWKVLGTHFAQIEYGLLNSNDQCTLYAWYEWYIAYMRHSTKLSHINLYLRRHPLLC